MDTAWPGQVGRAAPVGLVVPAQVVLAAVRVDQPSSAPVGRVRVALVDPVAPVAPAEDLAAPVVDLIVDLAPVDLIVDLAPVDPVDPVGRTSEVPVDPVDPVDPVGRTSEVPVDPADPTGTAATTGAAASMVRPGVTVRRRGVGALRLRRPTSDPYPTRSDRRRRPSTTGATASSRSSIAATTSGASTSSECGFRCPCDARPDVVDH